MNLSRLSSAILLVSLLATAACGDFRAPTDLRYPQVLAVRLFSPELRPGESTGLDVLCSDAAGTPLVLAPKEVALAPDPSGQPIVLPPEVSPPIVQQKGKWSMRAPDQQQMDLIATSLGLPPEAPLLVSLRITVEIGGEIRRADKVVAVLRAAGAAPAPNPQLGALLLDDAPVGEEGLTVQVGSEHVLTLASQAGSGPLALSWYAPVEDLKHFRSPTAILKPTEPAEGVLLVVGRNDRGGVDWKWAKLVVRP